MSDNRRRRQERAKKMECKYVHNVYSSQALSYDGLCDGPWPEIKNFLFSLRTGSFVADVGCGNGKYLTVRDDIVIHGVDTCQELSQLAYERHKNIIIANNLNLPYRSLTMDAVISVGVLHHFASFERRLQSVKELARILKPGGQILIYVWACEQKQRKFSSQDVLIPWNLENEKSQIINGFDAKNINMRRTSGCLEDQQSVANTESKISRSKVVIDRGSEARICFSDVDDDELPDNTEQQGNSSLISSINNFTAELKVKLQTFSFLKERQLRSGNVAGQIDGSDPSQYYHCQTNGNSNGLVMSEKRSDVSAECKEKLERTKQNKKISSRNRSSLGWNNSRSNKPKTSSANWETSHVRNFKRFYHVFIKDELSELVQSVRALNVLTQYYDHGNWVVRAEKKAESGIEKNS